MLLQRYEELSGMLAFGWIWVMPMGISFTNGSIFSMDE
nr:MAG TPA: hypothetical protein [Caudoviricetes sp.]